MKKYLKLLYVTGFVFLSVMLIKPDTVSAYTPEELYNYYENDDGTITIRGISHFHGDNNNIVIPDKLDGKTVTAIADGAFENDMYIVGHITLPNTLKTIGDRAFYHCSELRGDLIIPDGVVSIGRSAFDGCFLDGKLIIPDSVEYIGPYAFSHCDTTGNLKLPAGITQVEESAFEGCGCNGTLYIPYGIESIGLNAFKDCSNLTGDLTIPDSVKSISEGAFNGCSGFSGKLTISQCMKNIEPDTFRMCKGFTQDLYIPGNVKSIGERAFYDCNGFRGTLTIADGVESIGEEAFSYCEGFTGDLIFPDSIKSIGSMAFQGCGFTGDLTLSNGMSQIGDSAFFLCKNFTGTLTVPPSITKKGYNAFEDCTGFTKIVNNSNVSLFGSEFLSGDDDTFIDENGKLIYGDSYLGNIYMGKGTYIRTSTVSIPVKGIKLKSKRENILIGETVSLKATVRPSNAANKAVTWKSSNPKIVKVDKDGKVTGIKKGTATVTVTTDDGGYNATCVVKVSKPIKVRSIAFERKSYTVKKGKTLDLGYKRYTIRPTNATNKEVTFKSSDKKIVTVNKKGKVKGLRKGTATITVTTKDGKKTAKCFVTVK